MAHHCCFYNSSPHSLYISQAHPGLRGSIKFTLFVYSSPLLPPSFPYTALSLFSYSISRDGSVKVSYFYGMWCCRYHREAAIRRRRRRRGQGRRKDGWKLLFLCWRKPGCDFRTSKMEEQMEGVTSSSLSFSLLSYSSLLNCMLTFVVEPSGCML